MPDVRARVCGQRQQARREGDDEDDGRSQKTANDVGHMTLPPFEHCTFERSTMAADRVGLSNARGTVGAECGEIPRVGAAAAAPKAPAPETLPPRFRGAPGGAGLADVAARDAAG